MINQITREKSAAIQSFCRRHHADMLILFGSFACGADHAQSDLDLAVQPAAGVAVSKLHLIHELESLFDHRQIDLTVITKNTDPLLLFEIFSNGRLLYESTDGLFENSRLRAWHLYQDTAPLRRYEKAYNEERIRALGHVT